MKSEEFEKILKDTFGDGGNNYITNHFYEVKKTGRDWQYGRLSYVIQVYKKNESKSELWKTFWLNIKQTSARILDNWNQLTDRERYADTQKTIADYNNSREFSFFIQKLNENIFKPLSNESNLS